MTNQEIRDEIIRKLELVGREGTENVIKYLNGSDFFTIGCHRHHKYEGGLARHSLETCRYALTQNGGRLPEESVIIAALLHDLGSSHSAATRDLKGHGRKSVGILTKVCNFHLTKEEYEAILYHMHRDAPVMATNPLARLVCQADKLSAGGKIEL